MEFRILGPFAVESDDRPILLGGAKQRSLLALLLIARGRPVSTARLIDDLWDGRPPDTAVKSVQVYVARLRKALGEARLITHERGYELLVAPGEVDVDRFEELVRDAAGAAPHEAAASLREALELFRGAPLADLSLEPWARSEIARLEERRLTAHEARIDADLALGLHLRLVPELEALVAEHPFREHLTEQLMLALYRSGRQADALQAYRRCATGLRGELGLDPGRPLQELERRILRQDPALDAPPPPAAPGQARRRGWKLVVAGASLLLAAAAAAAAAISTRGGTTSLASVPPGVAIVDTSTGRLVAQIPWNEIKWPAEVITGDGSFWVWSIAPYSMVRIDPQNGHVLERISSPLDSVGWFNVDGRSLWLSGSRLVRVDIASSRPADNHQLSSNPRDDGLFQIARGDGSLWITRPQAGELLRVDPATGAVQKRFSNLPYPAYVAYGEGAPWVQSAHGIDRIDSKTNAITSTTPVPQPFGGTNLAVGGGYAWASDETKGLVYKIDRSGQIVATYPTGDGARQMSYADGTLWVVNQDAGTVTGIDAATGARRTLRFDHPLNSVAALHGKLLVEVFPGRTYEDRIDALKGKVARLVVPIYQFGHPDPAIEQNSTGHNSFIFQAERATCAPLLGYPDAPPPQGQRLVPEVATAMPTLSPDRRTYTFTVRNGFRFAPPSNAPLDARTFRYSIERALDPRLGPLAPGIGLLGDLEGAQAFRADRAKHISGIRVRGNRISFTLTRPSQDFLDRLALPYFCPVPRGTPALVGGVGVYTGPAPAGAGPYTFWRTVWNGEYAILKRNPNYGGSRPQRLDWIAFREGIDTERAVGRVERGRFDAVEHFDALLAPRGIVARRFAGASSPGGVSYHAFPQPITAYLALDARRPPFSDPKLRRAVAAALDRAALAGFWNMTPTDRLLPPTVRGARPSRFDPPRLARTHRLAGMRRITVRMAVQNTFFVGSQSGDQRYRRFVGAVHTALAPLGINVQPATATDLGMALRTPGSGVRLVALNTTLDYPDPASFLTQMLGKDVPTAWLPPSTRTAVDRLERLSGNARDRAAAALAARLATRDVPVVAFGTTSIGAVLGPRLGCRIWNGVDPGLDLAALCLAPS